MLRIEKVSHHYDVVLGFKQHKIFNSSFLKALFLALGLHLLPGLIFYIGPFKIVENNYLLKAFVDTEIVEQEMNVVAQIHGDKKALKFQKGPKGSSPTLPSVSPLMSIHHLESIPEPDFLNHPFVKLENDLHVENFFAAQKKKGLFFQISLGGSIAKNNSKVTDALIKDESFLSFLKTIGSLHIVYRVLVENKTGRIFFLEPKDTNLTDSCKQRISEFLKGMFFEPLEKGFVTSGEIAIDYDFN